MNRHRFAAFAAVALATTLPLAAGAQELSEADRKNAARAAFAEGNTLQSSGRYAEALAKFQAAESLYSAPSNQLRIAQCQALTQHLVEAVETYRTLTRQPPADSAPQAFKDAYKAGLREMPAVEARVPRLTITTLPDRATVTSLTVNDVNLPVALVGVERPVNPGVYRVVISSTQGSGEVSAPLNERETRRIVVPLSTTTAPPAYVPPTAGTTATGAPTGTTGSTTSYVPPTSGTGKATGTATGANGYPVTPTKVPTKNSLLLGGTVGFGATALETTSEAGGMFELEGGLRFARNFYVSAVFQKGAGPGNTATHVHGGFFSADNAGIYGELGLGRRAFSATDDQGVTYTVSGLEYGGGVGYQVKLGSSFRVLPKVSYYVADVGTSQVSLISKTYLLGVSGFYNIDF